LTSPILYPNRSASDNSNSNLPVPNNRSCFDHQTVLRSSDCAPLGWETSRNTLCICNAHASPYVEDRRITTYKTLKSDSFHVRRSECYLGSHPPRSYMGGQSSDGDYTMQSEHMHTRNTRAKKTCEALLRARVIHLQRWNLGLRNCDITSRRMG
jgi:hypothetical protein